MENTASAENHDPNMNKLHVEETTNQKTAKEEEDSSDDEEKMDEDQ